MENYHVSTLGKCYQEISHVFPSGKFLYMVDKITMKNYHVSWENMGKHGKTSTISMAVFNSHPLVMAD